MAENPLRGGCLCGAVRFEAAGAPYRVGLCHCMTCRKMGGGAFSVFAVYPRDKVTVTGETGVFASSEKGRRHFCRACGSPVYGQDAPDELDLCLGCFDEPNRFRPTYEVWIGRREAWLPEIEGVVRYEHNRAGRGRSEP